MHSHPYQKTVVRHQTSLGYGLPRHDTGVIFLFLFAVLGFGFHRWQLENKKGRKTSSIG